MFSDLRRPSVHHPSLPAAGSLGIPYSQPYFGPQARQDFLQDQFQMAEKTTAKSADAPRRPAHRLLLFLMTPLTSPRKSTCDPWPPVAARCSPGIRVVLLSTPIRPKTGKLAFGFFRSEISLQKKCFGTSAGLPCTTPHCVPLAP